MPYLLEEELAVLEDALKCARTMLEAQDEELAALREALRFYAAEENWRAQLLGIPRIDSDYGRKARETLERWQQ